MHYVFLFALKCYPNVSGIMGLYQGISASILRQMTYSLTRFGIYETCKQQWVPAGVSISNKINILYKF